MTPIKVDCTFSINGTVRIRRVELNGRWHPVGQGRQWVDRIGRHVLVMLLDDQVRELVLRSDKLIWYLLPEAGPKRTAV